MLGSHVMRCSVSRCAVTGYSAKEMLGASLVDADAIKEEFKESVRQVKGRAGGRGGASPQHTRVPPVAVGRGGGGREGLAHLPCASMRARERG